MRVEGKSEKREGREEQQSFVSGDEKWAVASSSTDRFSRPLPGQLETQVHSQTLLYAIALMRVEEKSFEVTTRELVLV